MNKFKVLIRKVFFKDSTGLLVEKIEYHIVSDAELKFNTKLNDLVLSELDLETKESFENLNDFEFYSLPYKDDYEDERISEIIK